LKYFEDYYLSLTQRLGKIAFLEQPPKQIAPGQPTIPQETLTAEPIISFSLVAYFGEIGDLVHRAGVSMATKGPLLPRISSGQFM
jgi:hypothetical protein